MKQAVKKSSILKEFTQYTILNVLGMAGLSCYILADTFFISKGLGPNGLAALSLAIPIYNLIHGTGLMLGIGGAAKFSVLQGQKAQDESAYIFTNTLYPALLFSLCFMVLGVFGASGLTSFLGADAEIFPMTETYLRVILLFSPAFIMNDIVICFVRNDGNPGLSMTAMLAGSLANIILDYILIFPLQMGILGAVLATGIAPLLSLCILSRHWKSEQNRISLTFRKPSQALTVQTLSLGLPSMIAEAASGIVIVVFNNRILLLQGTIGVAAYSIIANLSLVVTAIYTGMAQGIQPIASRAYGLGRQDQLKKLLKYSLVTLTVASVGLYASIFYAAQPIAAIFNSSHNPKLQDIAVYGLKLYFCAIFFAGFNIIAAMYLTATEKALPAQIISLLRGLILIIPMVFLLSQLAGMTGIWLTYPITEGLVFIVSLLLLWKTKHRSR